MRKQCIHIEKLMIALHINEKRMKDVDEQIDDGDLNGFITDEQWSFIEKERFEEQQRDQLLSKKWFKPLLQKYADLCNGPTINQERESVIKEEASESENEEEEGSDSDSEDEGNKQQGKMATP